MVRVSGQDIKEIAWLESVTWRKPGVVEVRFCRWTLDRADWMISSSRILECVDDDLLGEINGVEFEFVSGMYKVTIIFSKGNTLGGGDRNKYSMRASMDRDNLFNHPSIDQICKKYDGYRDVNRREVYFPKTIDKKKLKGKGPNGRPWTGANWPVLGEGYPDGHIRNPFHGMQFFFLPSVEFTMENLEYGGFNFNKVSGSLGYADVPPQSGFAFLASSARAKRVGGGGRVSAQVKWIVSDVSLRKRGNDFTCKKTWRSKVDPGWPKPVYKK